MAATLKTTVIQEPSSGTVNMTLGSTGGVTFGSSITSNTITSAASTALTIQSAGTTAMTIDASQNVGIGTTSPGAKLDVSSSAANIIASRSTGGFAGFIRLAPTGSQTYDFYTINGVEVARITGDSSYLAFGNGSSATERMRIDSSGNLQVGGTTVTNTVGYVNSRTNARAWITFVDNGSVSVSSNYNVSSVTRNAASDYTLNYATALATSTYAFAGMSGSNSTSMRVVNQPYNAQTPSTTSLRVIVTSSDGTLGPIGSTEVVSVVVFGN